MMKRNVKLVHAVKGTLFVMVAGAMCAGCLPLSIPASVEVEMTEPMDFEGVPAGVAIQIEPPEISLCDGEGQPLIPELPDINEIIRQQAGDFVANLVHLEGIDLVDVTLVASQGDFGFLTDIELAYNSPDQGEVSLGSASAANGLASPIVLTPDTTVDFLDIIENDLDSCPSISLKLTGETPTEAQNPVIVATLNLLIRGRVGL